jgi:hypothetical protein
MTVSGLQGIWRAREACVDSFPHGDGIEAALGLDHHWPLGSEILGKVSYRGPGLRNTNIDPSVLINVLTLSEIQRQCQEEKSERFRFPN